MVLDVIKRRWSPLSFSGKPVEEHKLRAILEAAAFAPSSMNEQPWLFVMTTREKSDVFNDFAGFLEESNRAWARNAYAFIISFARTRFSYKDRLNKYAFHDTGMAVANMLLQASSMDVYIHQMGGYSVEKVRDYFRLPEGIEPVTVMAVGYLGDGSELTEDQRARNNTRKPRKPLPEYAFMNSFSEPLK